MVADHYQSVVTVFGFLQRRCQSQSQAQSALYLATRRLPLYPAMIDFLFRSQFFIIIFPPELESEVVDGSLSFDDLEFLEWGLAETILAALAAPYSLVELTDLVVSAGR